MDKVLAEMLYEKLHAELEQVRAEIVMLRQELTYHRALQPLEPYPHYRLPSVTCSEPTANERR